MRTSEEKADGDNPEKGKEPTVKDPGTEPTDTGRVEEETIPGGADQPKDPADEQEQKGGEKKQLEVPDSTQSLEAGARVIQQPGYGV